MSTAYVALGANLPFAGASPPETLSRALSALAMIGLKPHARSSLWRSPAWPPSDQPDFYNAVVALDSGGRSPQALFQILLEIEKRFGRERGQRWAARTLDLDIVAIDEMAGDFGAITLPHPRLQERAFVLAPFAEVAPTWRHPQTQQTAAVMLLELKPGGVERVGDLN
jgi:2-amino-4-hydroxy-6-hydroxymethyldihydropteridine diphosphokinase